MEDRLGDLHLVVFGDDGQQGYERPDSELFATSILMQ
jgi:hypothetical protein